MRVNKTNPEPTKTILTIKAEPEELQRNKQLAIKKLAPSIKVSGFRTGHVPPAVVEKNIDPNALQTEVLEYAISNLYASAARQEDLRPVSNPEIAIKKFVPYTELDFEATVPTLGKINITDYKKIKLAKSAVKVGEKDVKDVISSLAKRSAERKEVDRAIKNGDEATIDFKGTDSKGMAVAGADAKDYPLEIGSKSFIPGFEEELIGLKLGEEKTFKVTFPNDYGAKALQGKKVTFVVKINKISELEEPKIDDNFAAAVGPFKTVDELKADIKKQLTIEKEREANAVFENELLDKIASKSEIEIPRLLIDEQVERIETEEKQNLLYRGQTWEEHLSEEGVTAEDHRQQKRPEAEQRVKIGIILSEIAEMENIQATPEEVEVRLQIMKGQYKDPQAQVELNKPEALRDIETRIRTEKVLAKLAEYATKK
jgi:trigger factor